MLDVSICIVNWNGARVLPTCLRSIVAQPWRVSYEVIVVDNASSDGSKELVQHDFPQIRLHANAENLGFARANNQAFGLAAGRYVLLLNNDTLVLPGTLDGLVQFLDEHPQAGIAGCRVIKPDGLLQPSCRKRPNLGSMVLRAFYLDKVLPQSRWSLTGYPSWNHDTVREVEEVSGCCLLARRKVIDEVGGLDERFFMFWEETDWCYRVRRRGWKILFTPDVQIIHYGGQSTSLQSARMSIVYYQSLLKLFEKYYGPMGALFVRALSILGVGWRLVYWSLGWLLQPNMKYKAAHKIGAYWPAWRWLLTGATGAPSNAVQ